MALIEMFGGVGPGGVLPAGSSGQTLRHDGAGWLANAVLSNDGSTVTVTPAAAALGMKVAAATSAGTTPAVQIENNVASLVWLINTSGPSSTGGSSVTAFSGQDPTAAGHRLGVFEMGVRAGGTNQVSARIAAFAKAAWSAGDKGAYISFFSTPVGTASMVERMRIEANGDIYLPFETSELATTATGGFPQLPTMNGIPTGVPLTGTGLAPLIFNRAGFHQHVYLGSSWRQMGNGAQSVRTISPGGSFSLNPEDYLIVASATANPLTVTLPSAAVAGVRTLVIRLSASSGHSLSVQRSGSDTIDMQDGTSQTSISTSAVGKTWRLTSDGVSKWYES